MSDSHIAFAFDIESVRSRSRSRNTRRTRGVLLTTVMLSLVAVPVTEQAKADVAPRPDTHLAITLWSDGASGPAMSRWSLRCQPPGGTLPGAAAACGRLSCPRAQALLFSRQPGRFSDDEYGGPAVLRIRGTYRGRPVARTLRELNSAQSAEWRRIAGALGNPLPMVAGRAPA